MTKRKRDALEPDPQWKNVAEIVPALKNALTADGRLHAEIDQASAYLRDTFDELGISVRHEPSVYTILATVGVVVEMTKNGVRNGNVPPAALHAIAELARSVSLSLLDFLPAEALDFDVDARKCPACHLVFLGVDRCLTCDVPLVALESEPGE